MSRSTKKTLLLTALGLVILAAALVLCAVLRHPWPERAHRETAPHPASNPQDTQELDRLTNILMSGQIPEAREAALAMGKLKSPAAVDRLIAALSRLSSGDPPDPQTAMGVGLALGELGDPRAIPALLTLFDRPDALEILAANPISVNLATVAHWSLIRITSPRKTGRALIREGRSWLPSRSGTSIQDPSVLRHVRDAWRANLKIPSPPESETERP